MKLEPGFDFTSPLGVILTITSLTIYIMLVIAEWRILEKAGEKGWKALIPFYNVFISHHVIGMRHIWFIIDIVLWFIEVVTELAETFQDFPWYIDDGILFLASIFTIISEVIHVHKLCECFGKRLPFKIGMVILPQVFTLIIAFGSAKYRKPESKHSKVSSGAV